MNNRPTLADFLERNIHHIVDEAEVFAASQKPEGINLNAAALRDHIPDIISCVVADLRTPQTALQAQTKAEGHGAVVDGTSAANLHGRLRARVGFNIDQMVAEYRALRASVLRLWLIHSPPDAKSFEEMVRFNEAIDQAVAESVAHFSVEADAWRQVFLGVLGHDLRGPLSVIMLTSDMLSHMVRGTPYADTVAGLLRSGQRMNQLLDDLLDFSRTSLGMGIRIKRADVELADAVSAEVKDLRIAYPNSRIELMLEGDTQGKFDASRVREALHNLVSNAATYGKKDGVISVRLTAQPDKIELKVQNSGVPLSVDELQSMFEPMKRRQVNGAQSVANLGLGLFIVRAIAKAHGGDIIASTDDGITSFTMWLNKS